MPHPGNDRRKMEREDRIRERIEQEQQAQAVKGKMALVCEEPGCNSRPFYSHHKGERITLWCGRHLPGE